MSRPEELRITAACAQGGNRREIGVMVRAGTNVGVKGDIIWGNGICIGCPKGGDRRIRLETAGRGRLPVVRSCKINPV